MNDDFNMSLRKFLKQVGVTSQQAIEAAVREKGAAAAGREVEARAVISIPELGLEHTVTGRIRIPD